MIVISKKHNAANGKEEDQERSIVSPIRFLILDQSNFSKDLFNINQYFQIVWRLIAQKMRTIFHKKVN